jgi:hypothetical protein
MFTGDFNLPNILWEKSDIHAILSDLKLNRFEILEQF